MPPLSGDGEKKWLLYRNCTPVFKVVSDILTFVYSINQSSLFFRITATTTAECGRIQTRTLPSAPARVFGKRPSLCIPAASYRCPLSANCGEQCLYLLRSGLRGSPSLLSPSSGEVFTLVCHSGE